MALGFDEDAIDSCSFAVCENNREVHQKLMEFIRHRSQLYSHCVVPLNCILLTAMLYRELRGATRGQTQDITLNSLSQLYVRLVLHIIHKDRAVRNMFTGITPGQKSTLRALAKMAANSLLTENSQIIFSDEDLDRYQIPVSDDPIVTGLMEIYTQEDGLDVARTRVSSASFIHLCIQEFLAAVHVCLSWTDRDINTLAVVDTESRTLDNVQLFTAGLLTDTDVGHPFLQSLFKQEDNPVGKRLSHFMLRIFGKAPDNTFTYRGSQFVDAMRTQNGGGWISKPSKLAKLQIIRCVHEGKMEGMMEEIDQVVLEKDQDYGLGWTLDLSDIPGGLLPHHMASIAYFTEHSRKMECLR